MNIIKHKEKLIAELRNKEYRDAFVSEHIDTGIPFQIRALREQKQRGWKQNKLASLMGVSQAWISRIEDPNYSGYSIKTLLKLASVFDVALIVSFAPFSKLIKWELDLSPESLQALSFEDEFPLPDKKEETAISTETIIRRVYNETNQSNAIPIRSLAPKQLTPSATRQASNGKYKPERALTL